VFTREIIAQSYWYIRARSHTDTVREARPLKHIYATIVGCTVLMETGVRVRQTSAQRT